MARRAQLLTALALACLVAGASAGGFNASAVPGLDVNIKALKAGLGEATDPYKTKLSSYTQSFNGMLANIQEVRSNVTNPLLAALHKKASPALSAASAAASEHIVLANKALLSGGAALADARKQADAAVDSGAAVVNSAAAKANEALKPAQSKVARFSSEVKSSVHSLVSASANSVKSALSLVTDGAEKVALPVRDHIANATAPGLKTLDQTLNRAFVQARDAATAGNAALTNFTAPLNQKLEPLTDAANGALGTALGAKFTLVRDSVVKTVDVINKAHDKLPAVEELIHNVTDPVDKGAKEARDTARSAVKNATSPLSDFGRKLFPGLRTPQLSQVFSGIFENLPPPAERDINKDPKREYDPVWPLPAPGRGAPSGERQSARVRQVLNLMGSAAWGCGALNPTGGTPWGAGP
jgi:hypothetical protein